jgi:hypothetical protein
MAIEVPGDESRADPLDAMPSRFSTADYGGLSRFDCDGLEGRVSRLDVSSDSSDRSTRSDPGNDRVDLTCGILPNLRSSRLFMDGRIGWVLELLRDPCVRIGERNIICFLDCPSHPFSRWR